MDKCYCIKNLFIPFEKQVQHRSQEKDCSNPEGNSQFRLLKKKKAKLNNLTNTILLYHSYHLYYFIYIYIYTFIYLYYFIIHTKLSRQIRSSYKLGAHISLQFQEDHLLQKASKITYHQVMKQLPCTGIPNFEQMVIHSRNNILIILVPSYHGYFRLHKFVFL